MLCHGVIAVLPRDLLQEEVGLLLSGVHSGRKDDSTSCAVLLEHVCGSEKLVVRYAMYRLRAGLCVLNSHILLLLLVTLALTY